MLATANGLKESLGEYWTDGLVILWLKPRSGTRRFNQRPPSTSVREIISSNGGFNLRFYIPPFSPTEVASSGHASDTFSNDRQNLRLKEYIGVSAESN